MPNITPAMEAKNAEQQKTISLVTLVDRPRVEIAVGLPDIPRNILPRRDWVMMVIAIAETAKTARIT